MNIYCIFICVKDFVILNFVVIDVNLNVIEKYLYVYFNRKILIKSLFNVV